MSKGNHTAAKAQPNDGGVIALLSTSIRSRLFLSLTFPPFFGGIFDDFCGGDSLGN